MCNVAFTATDVLIPSQSKKGILQRAMMFVLFVFAVASATVAYIIAGYPILLATVRMRRAPPVAKDLAHRPNVSLILAVHNGAEFIQRKLASIAALEYPHEMLEVLVVSDGSTDQTDALVQACPDARVRLIRVEAGGKAAALNAGLARAAGEILFFTDVRQPLHPAALMNLAANFADPSVGAVSGELRYVDPQRGEQADLNLYWRYELWARRQHSSIDSALNLTGCIYAMRRSLASPLPPDTLADDLVLPVGAFLRGYRIVFDGQAVAYDAPAPPGSEYHRRMRTLAGLWQLIVRQPKLFTRTNRMRFHFVSHKVGRLALPWALLVVLAATVALDPSGSRTFLLWSEAALFALALLDFGMPPGFPLRRLTSPARTFLVMNTAALLSVQVFFRSPQNLWRPSRVRPVVLDAGNGSAPPEKYVG
jgi:cellulose synthase/poly-beta-1,6-N-acetylglucosamine synthase-like glycosyltransferase